MKRGLTIVMGALAACVASAQLPKLDDLMKGSPETCRRPRRRGRASAGGDEKTNAAGIKE